MSARPPRAGKWLPAAAGLLVLALAVAAVVWAVRFRGQPAAPPANGPGGGKAEASPLAHGRQLFERYCAACHGDKGDGAGPVAHFLYPRPRNFGEGAFRVVTTTNRMPSDDDLLLVITRGMPGSAMMPFGHLPEADRRDLVGYVRQLTHAAVLDRERRQAEGRGETVRLDELTEDITALLRPGPVLAVPSDLPAFGPQSVARGKKVYAERGCSACHGPTGMGDGAQEQRDDSGMPVRPRDFGRGIFKGGHTPEQLYARLILGLPGSPMPATPDLSPAAAGDLINFVLALSPPEARARQEHRRQRLLARRSPSPLADDVPSAVWDTAAEAAAVTVTPLWWRDNFDPGLKVAALHDGQTLAVRLTWQDPSRDDSRARTEDFEDMAAVQLFKGDAEPFLGMGAAGNSLDLWLWRASWHAGDPAAARPPSLDWYPFETAAGADAGNGPPKPPPAFLTAVAAGNPHARADAAHTAGSLVAAGPGTVTFRPRPSQQVTARSAWKGGRWEVVLRRPLAAGPDGGLPLAAGERCSAAFALWDGRAGDRNGQKLVSVWHDLQLE